MKDQIREHYNLYYRYDILSGEDAGKAVNDLYDGVMRNDKNAIEQVVRILAGSTYYMAVNRLRAAGLSAIEDVDDVMQEISMQVLKKSFRGFPEKVTQEGFFGYLIGMAERCCSSYRKNYGGKKRQSLDGQEQEGIYANLKDERDAEGVCLEEEKRLILQDILDIYIQALRETDAPPYQVLTYCYAVVIPQIFKKTCNPVLMRMAEQMESRDGRQAGSFYNEKTGQLEGTITRDSSILMNWAMSAMHGQTAGILDQEFVSIYDLEPLDKEAAEFRWGAAYRENMDKEYENTRIRDIVITDRFSKTTMKNWPPRIARSLLNETEKRAMKNKEFREKSRNIAEDFFCR